MNGMIELRTSYKGPRDDKKEQTLFDDLKAFAAKEYPAYRVGSSRFEVTGEGSEQEHVHFLTIIPPSQAPADATR